MMTRGLPEHHRKLPASLLYLHDAKTLFDTPGGSTIPKFTLAKGILISVLEETRGWLGICPLVTSFMVCSHKLWSLWTLEASLSKAPNTAMASGCSVSCQFSSGLHRWRASLLAKAWCWRLARARADAAPLVDCRLSLLTQPQQPFSTPFQLVPRLPPFRDADSALVTQVTAVCLSLPRWQNAESMSRSSLSSQERILSHSFIRSLSHPSPCL